MLFNIVLAWCGVCVCAINCNWIHKIWICASCWEHAVLFYYECWNGKWWCSFCCNQQDWQVDSGNLTHLHPKHSAHGFDFVYFRFAISTSNLFHRCAFHFVLLLWCCSLKIIISICQIIFVYSFIRSLSQ